MRHILFQSTVFLPILFIELCILEEMKWDHVM